MSSTEASSAAPDSDVSSSESSWSANRSTIWWNALACPVCSLASANAVIAADTLSDAVLSFSLSLMPARTSRSPGFRSCQPCLRWRQFLKPSRVCVGEIHRIRDHGRGQLRLAGTVVFGAALLFLAGALGELVHQAGCATLFDGANHLVDGVGRADMPVCGAHVVDGVGQICHGFSYGGIAVQFGRGAENGGKLCGVADRTGQMRGV